jgi:hypothetical protein
MKKLILAAVSLVFWAAPVFAQYVSPENSSEYYYVNVRVEKVYPTKFGYMAVYRRGVDRLERVYLPTEWFTAAASKAELLTLPPGKNWPSLSVFYKKGEFSHVRLYVHKQQSHETWGFVPLPVNSQLEPFFENVETIKLKY